MSEENVPNITKSDGIFSPIFVDHYVLPDIDFNGCCLINNIDIPKKLINICISSTLNLCLRNFNTDFILNKWIYKDI